MCIFFGTEMSSAKRDYVPANAFQNYAKKLPWEQCEKIVELSAK